MLPLVDVRPAVLIYSKNNITRITHLEYCEQYLEQLSLAENRLTEMCGVSHLRSLTVLNLANNSIACIEGLKNLPNLTWLNLSANNIKVMENMGAVVQLQHLDLSHNCITSVGLLTHLTRLKTLLLHDNELTSLKLFPRCLPHGLVILSLAQNHLTDLSEFAYLSCLPRLGQLSLMDNPCVHPTHGAAYPLRG
ncbi:hypothetical protein NP493_77g05068 [Ridgeia piscesae]|uniref:Uncharacterized protein n=1 Tax=Ridgeia piscesae TaxID=27915 RepID=A0AAD9UI90_RIDPI|nr:hypothetical protein NP493_77g05068 [Ridgeia piscesae]